MISKKSRKVVAALLIGATVCASGTFAYFNSKTDLNNIMDKNAGAQNTLNITNGHVEIDGKIKTAKIGGVDSNWTYDVARIAGYGGKDVTVFEEANRSMDITGVGYDTLGKITTAWEDVVTTYPSGNVTTNRVKIGAPVTGVITNARPGDAVVLGVATAGVAENADNVDGTGLTFLNKSNITTNIRIDLERESDGTIKDSVVDEFAKLSKAGWIMRINSVTYDLSDNDYANLNAPVKPAGYNQTLNATDGDTLNYKNFYPDAANLTDAQALQLADKNTYDAAVTAYATAKTNFIGKLENIVKTVYAVKPATADQIAAGGAELEQAEFGLTIRFELPLLTENKYQDKNTVSADLGDEGIDIRKLFTVIATQENNPGWNVDGTDTQPFQD